MRRVLIVSPYFPPSTVAGVHRARILVKGLNRYGWEPIVFCVDEHFHEQIIDPELARLLPSDLSVKKVSAFPTALCRAVGIGDLGIRGYFHLKFAVKKYLKHNRADVLFITVLPGFAMTMGPELKRLFGLKLVLDYQDPWLPADYRMAQRLSKMWASHQIARLVEPRVIQDVDHFTAVSAGTYELVKSRYPSLPDKPFTAIPIGGDPEDFNFLRTHPRQCDWLNSSGSVINISYVGNIWPRALPVLRLFFRAIKKYRDYSEEGKRIRLLFVGTSNQADPQAKNVVVDIARDEGIDSITKEIPGRVFYLDAINILSKTDINVVLGSDEPHYTASKVFPVILAQKPIVAILHYKSSASELLRSVGNARLITFCEGGLAHKDDEIVQALKDLIEKPPPIVEKVEVANLDMEGNVSRQFANVFDRVMNES